MAPSANDFSAITELMDIKKLYEEAEEKWKLRIQEKDDAIAGLEADLQTKDRVIESHSVGGQELEAELQKARQENERIRQEAAARIAQLNERIKELNNRLMGGAPGPAQPGGQPQSGFFKR